MSGVIQERCLEAQTAIIGSMLIDDTCIGAVLSEICTEDFPSGPHKTVFAAIKQLFSSGEPVDPVIVGGRLDKSYQSFLAQCMEVTPTAAHAKQYCEILRRESRLLQLQDLGEQLRTVSDMETAHKLAVKVNALMVEQNRVKVYTAADLAMGFYKRMTSKEKPEYLSSGIKALDEKTYTELGDFIGIGGFPSSGKTAFALQWAASLAKKYRVGIYSFETGKSKTEDRIFAREAQIPLGQIKERLFAEDVWARVGTACSSVSALQLEFVPAKKMTAEDVVSYAISRRHQVIFIDYLQMIAPANPKDIRHEQVAEISRTLHIAAQSNKITIVALSQLSRPEKGSSGKLVKPGMQSFRESGQIEQDLDLAIMVYRAEPQGPGTDRIFKIVKNKEGQLGEIRLAFDGSTQTFSPSQKAAYDNIRKMARQAKQEIAQMRMEEKYTAAEREGKDYEVVDEPVPF